MKRLNLALALAAAALLALSGIAVAKDRGNHHRHHHDRVISQTGTVSSFDASTGKLTIALTNGESVTGMVTDATEIKCEGVDDRLQRRDHGSDDNGGEAPMGEAGCSTASLVSGEVVSEAELRLEGGAAVFGEIELGLHS